MIEIHTDQEQSRMPFPPAEPGPNRKPRWCWIGILSILCIVMCFALPFLGNIDGVENISYGLLILSPFLAIGSLVRIGLRNGELIGVPIVLLVLVLSSLFIYDVTYYKVPRARSYSRVVCSSNLRGLGAALAVYAEDYDGKFPSENWCDLLIEKADVSPKSFLCYKSGSKLGESDYCMNIYAVGKKLSELPGNMVLLFEADFKHSKGENRVAIRQRPSFGKYSVISDMFKGDEAVYLNQWNRVGGPELIDVNRHFPVCHIVMANGTGMVVRYSKLSDLRWNPEGSAPTPVFSTPDRKLIALAMNKGIFWGILGLLFTIGTVVLLTKYEVVRYWKFALILGILSSLFGLFFGLMSGEAYSFHRIAGGIAGAIFGFPTGICFAVVFAGRTNDLKRSITFRSFVTSMGMVTGIFCSTLVHMVLMVLNGETNPFGIVIGIPFGIFTGGILGVFSGGIIRKYYSQLAG
jgi:hypothetical protein